MKPVKSLDREECIERGINALYKELGPVEARRYISFTHKQRKEDSVARHHRLQNSLTSDDIYKEVRAAYAKHQ